MADKDLMMKKMCPFISSVILAPAPNTPGQSIIQGGQQRMNLQPVPALSECIGDHCTLYSGGEDRCIFWSIYMALKGTTPGGKVN